MPTDPVLTLIAEMRAKADAMPEGRLSACGADRGGCKCATVWNTADDAVMLRAISTEPEQGLYDGYSEAAAVKHAAYFASLDPALVRALLDVAEAQVRYIAREEATDPDNDDHLPDYYAAIQGWTDAISALRTLATDRVAS